MRKFSTIVALLVVATACQAEIVKVISVSQRVQFAGKLGNLVSRTLLIEVGGKRFPLVLNSYHDRFRPLPASVRPGDEIRLDHGEVGQVIAHMRQP